MAINPSTHRATVTENYVIGKMRDLWIFWGWFLVPLYSHYNATGCYMYNHKISNETIYQFIERNQIKMSIIEFQNSILLDRKTVCLANGENVTNNEVFISDVTVSTYSDDGERIFDTSFGVKENYKLYNYTADPTESSYEIYEALTRTVQIGGIAKNEVISPHRNILRYIPLFVAHMYPQMLERARETIGNITKASYLYVISYPNYSGYRIEHDPVHTAYLTIEAPQSQIGKYLVAIAMVAVVVLVIIAVIAKRRQSQVS